MAILFTTIGGLALLDALNPFSIAALVYLLGTSRPIRNGVLFTGATYVAYLLGCAFHGIRPSIPRASGRPFHEHPATLVRGLQGFSSFWISVSAVKGVGGAEGCPREGPACPAPRPPRGWR
jgi:hypothetical protein